MQALWRNIAERGLTRLYKENAKARELLRCYGALATLPVGDVIRGFNAIADALRGLLHTTQEIPLEFEAALAGKTKKPACKTAALFRLRGVLPAYVRAQARRPRRPSTLRRSVFQAGIVELPPGNPAISFPNQQRVGS